MKNQWVANAFPNGKPLPEPENRSARHAGHMASANSAKGFPNLPVENTPDRLELQETIAWLDAAARNCDPLSTPPDFLARMVAAADALAFGGLHG
jgi:hypothetical protein